ncbi:family 20 glycosylhydrolase [Parahaliea aestuarii]|uniref:beta-N-acetylhexosaminidase n=1 Tax=Parahaliea aestuarii TaxID=1852021 RepID=A0A5C8ZRD0_9GAMM|nr:family 20 glycosylhydrolase [Parahaliea aestuarii]TXS90364.1 family 20 glycosylhydrolase [Parahaliea aestuarii]
MSFSTLPLVTPAPQHFAAGEGECRLHRQMAVHTSDPSLQALAGFVAHSLALAPEGSAAAPALYLALDAALPGPEHYHLLITPQQLTLSGGGVPGVFYALQTLLQLLPPAVSRQGLPERGDCAVACASFRDGPALGWRGMHLDCSRHFFPRDFILRYLDLLALHKLNRFHWHLSDDQGWRFPSRRFPRLTEVGARRERTVQGHTSNPDRRYREQPHGGYYSEDDIRAVVEYAAQRQIAVIPELDIPGHAAALLAAYPEYACGPRADGEPYQVETHFGIFPDVLCPKEETFHFLQQLLEEVVALFPGDYVHIGGDEVVKTAWRNCPHCQQLIRDQDLRDEDGLHGYFVARVAGILEGLGKKVLGWDEVMDGDVSRDTTIMCWNSNAGERALQAGYPVVMCPVDRVYFDFYQSTSLDEPAAIHGLTPLRRVYDYHPATPAGESGRLLGAQGNIWTEYLATPEAVSYAALPRLCALAESLWRGEGRQWPDFCRRLPALTSRLRQLGYRVADSHCKPLLTLDERRDGKLRVKVASDVPGVITRYTLDGAAPDAASPACTDWLPIEQECLLRATGQTPDGTLYGDERQQLAPHLGLHKTVYRWREEGLQQAPELALLTNGCRGNGRIFHYHEWAVCAEELADIVVDLEQPQVLTTLRFNLEAGAHRRLARPAAIEVLGSSEDQQWQTLAHVDGATLPADGAVQLDLGALRLRYLRLRLDNSRRYYSPETRQLERMPLYLDELVLT